MTPTNPPTDQDACELLDADHIAVKHLFVEYARLAMLQADAAERTALAMKICEELTVHAAIEEEIFYPALEDALPETSDLMEEAREEHQEAKDMIAQIQAMGEAGPEMDDLVAELNRAIEHHVKEERDEIFPKAKGAGLDLADLAQQMRERQQALQTADAA
ncbi:hemerythrin domain-containing protein [Caenimonas aquaedulcis]|uniref:Hemerythrin domain-containing protein n=1 Tax=Caenimonas aquaedulcis TaxID=2793270 RepID=A0A931MG83_9BURK|nr:hemerythrin domain-containing protein [Caenimonas aquaedulcis]MBG9387604.1 hemerythrin domain-containing protein [Caenimonas aquaedulcis]